MLSLHVLNSLDVDGLDCICYDTLQDKLESLLNFWLQAQYMRELFQQPRNRFLLHTNAPAEGPGGRPPRGPVGGRGMGGGARRGA